MKKIIIVIITILGIGAGLMALSNMVKEPIKEDFNLGEKVIELLKDPVTKIEAEENPIKIEILKKIETNRITDSVITDFISSVSSAQLSHEEKLELVDILSHYHYGYIFLTIYSDNFRSEEERDTGHKEQQLSKERLNNFLKDIENNNDYSSLVSKDLKEEDLRLIFDLVRINSSFLLFCDSMTEGDEDMEIMISQMYPLEKDLEFCSNKENKKELILDILHLIGEELSEELGQYEFDQGSKDIVLERLSSNILLLQK